MPAITVYSNWCYFDRLEDRDLEHGERVAVQWPDGSTTEHDVEIVRSHTPIMDHGHNYDAPIKEAFVSLDHRGTSVRVRLAEIDGIDVRRIGG